MCPLGRYHRLTRDGIARPIGHGVTHLATMFAEASSFCRVSLIGFVEGEHTPVLIALGGVGLLYFMMQPYIDGAPLDWFAVPFAVPKLMAGPADITGVGDIAWAGMLASLTRLPCSLSGDSAQPARRLRR